MPRTTDSPLPADLFQTGFQQLRQHRLPEAQAAFAAAAQAYTTEADSPAAPDRRLAILAHFYWGQSCLLAADLAQTKAAYSRGEALAQGWSPDPTSGYLATGRGELAYEANQLEDAAAWLQQAEAKALSGDDAQLLLLSRSGLAQVRLSLGEGPASLRLIRLLEGQIGRPGQSIWRAQWGLAQGELEPARRWLRAQGLRLEPGAVPNLHELQPRLPEYLMLVRLRLAEKRPEGLDELLAAVDAAAAASGRTLYRLRAALLWARKQAQTGAWPEADASLARALTWGGPAGFVRSFLDLVGPLLDRLLERAALAGQSPSAVARLQAARQTGPGLGAA